MNIPELQNEETRKRSFLEDEKYENGSYQCMCIFL